jgi:glycosyltransferase involved in cell wall biosynthesis
MKRISLSNTVIINATNIGYKYHGIGVYSLNILEELIKLQTDLNFIVYLNKSCKPHIKSLAFPENFKIKWVPTFLSPDKNFKGHFLRLIHSNLISIRYWKHLQFNTSQLEINFFRRNQIVTIHDVIPLLFKEYHKKLYPYFKFVLKYGLKYTQFIITPSTHSKELLQNIYELPKERVKVIYNGANTLKQNLKKSNSIEEENFLLYLGRINRMKNIRGLLKAFDLISSKIDQKLVIVGNDENELKKEIHAARLNDVSKSKIIFKKNLTEEEKCTLMKKASAFLFVSLYEGFGLPPIEAMACGCPVIASKNSSLPEVCGDAAYYVDPKNHSEIADGIMEILNNDELRTILVNKGINRSLRFNWSVSAKEHLRVMEHVIYYSHFPVEEKRKRIIPFIEKGIKSIDLEGVKTTG